MVTAMTPPSFHCITMIHSDWISATIRAGAAAALPSKRAFTSIVVMHQCHSHPMRTHLDNQTNKKRNLPKNINHNGTPYNSFDMVTPKIRKKVGRE